MKSKLYVTCILILASFMMACAQPPQGDDLFSDTPPKSTPEEEENTPTPPPVYELDHFVVTGVTAATDIGVEESVTVTAYDTQGEIKTDYVGTIQFASDDGSATLPSDYTFTSGDAGVKTFTDGVIFSATGTYYVEASDSGKTGQQAGVVVTNTQCPGRTIGFQLSSSGGSEGTTSVDVTVEMSSACINDVTVDYATADGTAGSSDYTATSGTLNIPAGTTSKTINLTINDDGDTESQENFTLNLSNPGKHTTLGTSSFTYNINDNDGPPVCPSSTIGFQTSTASADEGTTAVNLTVELSATCTEDVSVDYVAMNLSATSPSDYVAASGTATVTAGQTTTTIPLTIVDDSEAEPTENLKVVLSNAGPLDAELGLSVLTYSITDNDGGPAPCPVDLGFTTNSSSALESVTSRSFTVEIDATCGQDITVDYATSDITATQPGDYTLELGSVTITAGNTTANFDIAVADDGDTESDESFKVTLSNPSLAEVTLTTSVHTATIMDDDNAFKNYYVRKTGDDANDGLSAANAFLTIGQAMSVVAEGDTVFVGAGTYAENVVPVSGTVTNPISLIGDRDGVNTGDAGEVIINTTGTLVDFTNVSHFILDRFKLTGGNIGVYGTGTSSNISLRNILFQSMPYGIIIFQVDGLYVEHNEFDGLTTIGFLAYSGSNNVEVKNNLFHSSMYGIFLGADVPSTLIENNTLYSNSFYQIYMQSNVTATIRNNIITNGGMGIADIGNNSTITNSHNTVWNNTTDYQNVTAGTGRVDADPEFADPGTDFRVDPTSPTIDAGTGNASSVTFSDGSDLTSRATREDSVTDGNTGLGDGTTVNMGFHY